MKLKSTWIPFILSFISIIGLRIYQFLSIGNASVKVQWDNIELACLVIAIVAVLFIIVMSFISKDVPKVFVLHKDMFFAGISILTSLLIIGNSINELMIYMNSDRDLVRLFLGVLGFAASIIFIMTASCYIKGKNFFEKYKLLTLLPVVWALVRLLKVFFIYNSIPTDMFSVSTLLSEIFVLFFLFCVARMFTGLFNQSTFRKLFYFGFASILFIMICKTNVIISTLDAGRKISFENQIDIVTMLVLAVYILSFIVTIITGQDLEGVSDVTIEPLETTSEDVNTVTTQDVNTDFIQDTDVQNDMSEVDALIDQIKNENAEKLKEETYQPEIKESEETIIEQETDNQANQEQDKE